MFDAREGRPFSLPQQGNTVAQNFYFIITIYINIIYTILYAIYIITAPPMTREIIIIIIIIILQSLLFEAGCRGNRKLSKILLKI